MQRLRLRIRLLAPGRSSSLFSAARGGAADALSGAAAARGGAAAACGGAAAARGGAAAAAALCWAEAARAWALLVAVVGVAGELNLGVNSIKPDSVFSRGLDPDPINLTRIHNPA